MAGSQAATTRGNYLELRERREKVRRRRARGPGDLDAFKSRVIIACNQENEDHEPRKAALNVDVLDTSVVRGMRKQDILALSEARTLAVSPFTVWELLCHLDEVRKDETPELAYQRRRGHVSILQSLTILDDPFAQHAEEVGAIKLANPTRFEDRGVAEQIVARVMSVSTLAELDQQDFIHANGTKASLRNIAANARTALDAEESRFLQDMQNMWDGIKKSSHVKNPAKLTDNDIWEWLSAMVAALKRLYEGDGVAPEALLPKVCASIYPYLGYLLFRLRTYSKGRTGTLSIQPNDTEDGYLCMHLRLLEDNVLVVGDGKTERALRQAIDLWNAKVPELPARCGVIRIDAYKALARFTRTQQLAYRSWQDRGCPSNDDWRDWFRAESSID